MTIQERIAEVLTAWIADDSMWIDANGEPLAYSPEREARIGDFVTVAAHAIVADIHCMPPADLADLIGGKVQRTCYVHFRCTCDSTLSSSRVVGPWVRKPDADASGGAA